MRPQQTSQRHMQSECDTFNNRVPVGYEVRYWKGLREGDGKVGKVSYPAQIMGGHTAVVYISGVGAVALTHVEPM